MLRVVLFEELPHRMVGGIESSRQQSWRNDKSQEEDTKALVAPGGAFHVVRVCICSAAKPALRFGRALPQSAPRKGFLVATLEHLSIARCRGVWTFAFFRMRLRALLARRRDVIGASALQQLLRSSDVIRCRAMD